MQMMMQRIRVLSVFVAMTSFVSIGFAEDAVMPSISSVAVNGIEVAEGGTCAAGVFAGVPTKFNAVIADPAHIDVANGIVTCWTIRDGWSGHYSYKRYYITNDTVNASCTYTFATGGKTQLVRVKAQDKDMAIDDEWGPEYSFYVMVDSPPCVQIINSNADGSYAEDSTNSYISIALSTPASADLTIEIEAVRRGRDGTLAFESNLVTVVAGETFGTPQNVRLIGLDGTGDSSFSGFLVTARVITEDVNPFGQKWCDFYRAGSELLYVYNVAPVCDVTPENSTAWNVVIGGTPTNSIHWQVSRDAAGDFAGTTSFPGIKVSFWGDCLNAQTFYVPEPSSGVFTPDLGSGMGDHVVYLTIEDKDGAGQYWTYQYEVGYPMETVDGISWCYWINDGKASIEYGSKGDLSGDITIPSTIGGCPVTSIGGSAFEGCGDIVSVTIPEGVASIGDYAFAGCTSLTNVVFEGNAPTCGDGAFEGCSSECVVLVPPGSTGWGVEIPGVWNGLRIEYAEVGIVSAQEQIDGDGNITGIVVNNPTATIGSVKTPWMIVRPDGKSGFANDFTTNAISVVSEDGVNYYAHVEGENGDRTKVIHFTVNESGIPSKHGDVIDITNSGEDNNAEEMKNRKLIGVKDGYLHFFPVDEAGSSLSYNPETGDKFERGKSYPMKFLVSDEKGTVVLVNNLWKSESGRISYVTEFLRIKENGIVEGSARLFPALSEDIKRTVIYDDDRRCFYVGDSEGNIYYVSSYYSDLMTTLPVPVTGLSCNAGNESGHGEEFFATSTKTNAFFNIDQNQYNVAKEYVKGDYCGYPKPMVPKTNDGLIKIIDNRRNGGKFLCVTTKGIIAVGD